MSVLVVRGVGAQTQPARSLLRWCSCRYQWCGRSGYVFWNDRPPCALVVLGFSCWGGFWRWPGSLFSSGRCSSRRLLSPLSCARPPNLHAPEHALSPLLPLSRPRCPALSFSRILCIAAPFLCPRGLLSVLLLFAECIQLIPGIFLHLGLLCPRRLQHRVQELDFIVVETAELVPQAILFFKLLLLRGSHP